MPRQDDAHVLQTISGIYTDRASFELNEDDIQTLRRHFDSIATLKDVSSNRTEELAEREAEFQKWKVSAVLELAVLSNEKEAFWVPKLASLPLRG